MDKRKPRGSESVVDELALAKSAAWAWYERGSGSDGRSFREVDAWCSKTDPKPSRYKLEALRNVQADQRSKNSLLDTYEIERISNHLQHYIESSRAKCHGSTAAAAEGVQKKKIPRGFWLRRGPVCGSSRDDVVENQSLEHRHRWRPEKGRVEVGRPPTVTVTLR